MRSKIDRAMIADIVGGSRDRCQWRQTMIRLARELDLKVIVEGVENLAQLHLLEEWAAISTRGFWRQVRSTRPSWALRDGRRDGLPPKRAQVPFRLASGQHPHQPARYLQRTL
jgi:predicted signal transduction protein with EAL and GGDEF domain